MSAEGRGNERRMIGSTIAGLLFGRTVWLPEEKAPDLQWVANSHKRNLVMARDIYRDRLRSESEGIESVRRRAEFALTAIIAAVGLSASAFERLWSVTSESFLPISVWIAGVIVVVFSALIFGGVAVSKKVLGSVDVSEFVASKGAEREEIRQYVEATHVTSMTRRAMVTVFRDGFLIALLGLGLLAVAHAISWTIPLSELSDSIVTC